ncbi:MAG: uracil-DNA glycosylase [Planctomycetota bacterium]|nr:uracil-DNA glycosylase [Planctomycetota bacterium]
MQFDLFDEQRNLLFGAPTYADFKDRLAGSGCTKCGLAESRQQIVVDRGRPGTGIMAIGEGPGAEEDRQGAAFVGKAGKLFDKVMASVGIDTNRDMLIANVVKCRPPENRTPGKAEAQACLPFLEKQISLANPAIIILLGATSLRHLDPEKKDFAMADEAGKFFALPAYPDRRFMVLYHPAALLYNARLKPDMWAHVQDLKRELDAMGLPRN